MSAHILIVEDEVSIRDNVVYSLESEGFTTTSCSTGAEALDCLEKAVVSLVLLDIGLPDMSGFEVCRRLLAQRTIPVIFLTARSEEIDRVVGLEMGGDDYVVKPFSPRELTARVRAVLRRTGHGESAHGPMNSAMFQIDRERLEIRYHDRLLPLSRTEYRLIECLARHPGRVFTRDQLMTAAWDEPDASFERTVDSHIKSIRAKLRDAAPEEDPIRTHRGVGYSLMEPTS